MKKYDEQPVPFYSFEQHGVTKTIFVGPEVQAIKDQFEHYRDAGYKIYGITTTYIPNPDREYTPIEVNRFFKSFYWNEFLPNYLFNDRRWLKKYKNLQPLIYSFIDEHEPVARKQQVNFNKFKYDFAIRLHHHAVIAVPPQISDIFETFMGKNTLKRCHYMIMTSCVEAVDLNWTLYAAKMFRKYNDQYQFWGPISNNSTIGTNSCNEAIQEA